MPLKTPHLRHQSPGFWELLFKHSRFSRFAWLRVGRSDTILYQCRIRSRYYPTLPYLFNKRSVFDSCADATCVAAEIGVIILIKLTNFHPFYIMNLILSNQKTSRCLFKMLKKRRIAPGRRNARESARGDGKEGSLLPVPFPFNTER